MNNADRSGKNNRYNTNDAGHTELLQRQSEMKEISAKVNQLSSKFTVSINVTDTEQLARRYEDFSLSFNNYEKLITDEISTKEVEKEKLFQETRLSIKLGKFLAYNSENDVYTFHDNFYKLYRRTTPRRLMPDLLKNNHLENPALSLVKSVDDIEEI